MIATYFLLFKKFFNILSLTQGLRMKDFPIYGNPELEAVEQMKEVMKYGAVVGALMADHHLGYSVPVGGVIAFENAVCVNGVGFDIACGNKAVLVNADSSSVRQNIYRTMNEVQKHISFGIGRKNNETVYHELFEDPLWRELPLLARLKDKAISQLGTVGSGNHYVDIFLDEQDRVWIGCHFGSRGFGHTICTHFIKEAGGKDGIHASPVILDEKSDLGEQYIKCMELAGRYAYAGRDWVCSRVARILRADILEEVHNHHNFAWKERHFDKDVWVVRKGATPAYPGQKGFVGGSMGDFSYILEGVDHEESKKCLYSTIHGAGRIMGRTEAKGKIHRKTGKVIKEGCIKREDMDKWIKDFDVELRGAGVDESPFCYKRIEQVLFAHRDTVKIIHKLKPIGVCMASENEVDPYKD
jgi:tRNA-splicing ligase RtcB